MDGKEPLVLPIVGAQFRSCIADLSSRVASVQEEAFRRAMLEDKAEEETTRRIRAFIEGISILLAPDPYNPHDPSAVSILMRFPDGTTEQAGYVKREVAAILTPILGAGGELSGRIYRLYPGEAEMRVGAG